MDLHEQAFLSAALGVGDERLERRLLVGFYLIRDCCRIADDPTWVPRVGVAKAMMDQAIVDAAFVPGEMELVALAELLSVLDSSSPPNGPALFHALLGYGIALMREAFMAVAQAVFELLDRLWKPGYPVRDSLDALFYHGLVLLRGENPIDAIDGLPLFLALRARSEGDPESLGLARVLGIERTLIAGNLPLGQKRAERLLDWARRHGSTRVEGFNLERLTAVHGRAGRFARVLDLASQALEPKYHFTVRLSGLYHAGNAFMDLGDLTPARAAFELLLLAPTRIYRTFGWISLMDLYARQGERQQFERIYERMVAQPMMSNTRIQLYQAAGWGWARLHDVVQARAAFTEAHRLARAYRHNTELIEIEDALSQLSVAHSDVTRAADVAPEVAAHVTALRDAHADDIAACMA